MCGIVGVWDFKNKANKQILAEKMIELFTNKKLKNKLIKNSKKIVKNNYSWKKVSSEINQLYQELL